MPNDEKLYQRIKRVLKSTKAIEPKKMFGGICFMHRGNMLCGIDGQRLMVRVGPDQYAQALSLKHVSVMDITGKPMKGFIFVSPRATKSVSDLKKWIKLGLNYTSSLPPKKSKSPKNAKDPIPLGRVKNFGPVTRGEFESMNLTTLEQVKRLGFEDTCRKWIQYYPERLNANAFLGVICSIEGTTWTKATSQHRSQAHSMVRMLRAEFGLPPVKKKRL